jgi:hypothetical protein
MSGQEALALPCLPRGLSLTSKPVLDCRKSGISTVLREQTNQGCTVVMMLQLASLWFFYLMDNDLGQLRSCLQQSQHFVLDMAFFADLFSNRGAKAQQALPELPSVFIIPPSGHPTTQEDVIQLAFYLEQHVHCPPSLDSQS